MVAVPGFACPTAQRLAGTLTSGFWGWKGRSRSLFRRWLRLRRARLKMNTLYSIQHLPELLGILCPYVYQRRNGWDRSVTRECQACLFTAKAKILAIQSTSLSRSPVRTRHICVRRWPSKVRHQLSENGAILKQSLKIFESSILSTETSVRLISTDSYGTSAQDIMCKRWK